LRPGAEHDLKEGRSLIHPSAVIARSLSGRSGSEDPDAVRRLHCARVRRCSTTPTSRACGEVAGHRCSCGGRAPDGRRSAPVRRRRAPTAEAGRGAGSVGLVALRGAGAWPAHCAPRTRLRHNEPGSVSTLRGTARRRSADRWTTMR
jgi:hypothetical protein